MRKDNFNNQDFRGHKQAIIPKIDESLAHTDAKTPC